MSLCCARFYFGPRVPPKVDELASYLTAFLLLVYLTACWRH